MRTAWVLVAVLWAGLASAQNGKTTAPPPRVTAVLRDYARGMTENRFDVKSKISTFDASGKLQKVKTTNHRLEFIKGRFRSPDAEVEADWTSSMRLRGNRGALGLEAHTDTALVYPVFTFAPSRRGDWVFEPTGAPDTFSFSYLPTQTCSTFEAVRRDSSLATRSAEQGK